MKGKFRKIIVMITVMSGITLLVGCNESNVNANNRIDEYFDLIEICSENHESICYDKNTGVMYYQWHEVHQYGMTPIYNADGTLKIFDGCDLTNDDNSD